MKRQLSQTFDYLKHRVSEAEAEKIDELREKQLALEKKHATIINRKMINRLNDFEWKIYKRWNDIVEEIAEIYYPYFGQTGKGKGARKGYNMSTYQEEARI